MALVTIKCPQGLERLIELGETTARSGDWSRPDAPAAIVGLWLSCQIARAELRGSLEVVDGRLQVAVTGEPEGETAKAIDRALAGWWDVWDAELRAAGHPALNRVDLDLSLPSEAGAIPLAILGMGLVVTVVAIGASTYTVTTLGKESLQVMRQWLAQNDEAKKRAAETAEVGDLMRNNPTSPAAVQRIADIGKRQAIATQNLTARPAESKDWWESLEGAAPWVAAAVLGAVWLAKR